MVPSGTPLAYICGNDCSPVASTVKANPPLPTVSEASVSSDVTCGLLRVTTAFLSIVCAVAGIIAIASKVVIMVLVIVIMAVFKVGRVSRLL